MLEELKKISLNEPGIIVSYTHNSVSENLGKIAVLLSLKSNADKNALNEFGKNCNAYCCNKSCLFRS